MASDEALRHSPLPWVIYSDRGDIKSSCKGFPEVAVAKVLGQETSGERQANAEMIVRAVNSHDVLVKALEQIWAIADNTPATEGQTDQIQEVADAAIAIVRDFRK